MTEIKAGNYYMCLKDIEGYDSFTKGKVYASLYDKHVVFSERAINVLESYDEITKLLEERE